jgi:di/tricarboxylate transporter
MFLTTSFYTLNLFHMRTFCLFFSLFALVNMVVAQNTALNLTLTNGTKTRVFTPGTPVCITMTDTSALGLVKTTTVRGFLYAAQNDSIIIYAKKLHQQERNIDHKSSSHKYPLNRRGTFRVAIPKHLVNEVRVEKDMQSWRMIVGTAAMVEAVLLPLSFILTTQSQQGKPHENSADNIGAVIAASAIMGGVGYLIRNPIMAKKSKIKGRHKKGKWVIVA